MSDTLPLAHTEAPPPYTLADLLRELEGVESARKTNRAALEHGLATGARYEAISLWSQGANWTYSPPPGQGDAIDRLELLCDARCPEPGLTAKNLRLLRVALCEGGRRTLREADALPVSEVADLLEGRGAGNDRKRKQTIEASLHPPGGVHLAAGGYVCGERHVPFSGHPLAVLSAMLKNCHRCVTADYVETEILRDSGASDTRQAAKDAVQTLRDSLRQSTGVEEPIQTIGKGADLAWKLLVG